MNSSRRTPAFCHCKVLKVSVFWSRYQTGGSEDAAVLVVHMTPEPVLNTDQYRSWMERFGSGTHLSDVLPHGSALKTTSEGQNLQVIFERFSKWRCCHQKFSIPYQLKFKLDRDKVASLQVSRLHRTPDPQRARLHRAQRAQPQDPGAAQHHPPGDLPSAGDLQDQSTGWS